MPVIKIKETFKRRPELPDAISTLKPGNGFSISIDPSTIRNGSLTEYDWNTLIWNQENPDLPPTFEESKEKLKELISEWEEKEYAIKRFINYPKIEEQLAMLYDDIKSGISLSEGSWFNSITKVKNEYPKS